MSTGTRPNPAGAPDHAAGADEGIVEQGAAKAGFRGDIQGMRALAVLMVIAAHAGIRTAAGGFIGVDVFFVISGFLITGLLVREVDRRGRVSLVDFYARRARRILPAAVLVLVVTCVASVQVLPFVRTIEIFKDAIWAAFFGANIRYAVVGTDYFAQGQPPSPLQHYWSLSVEEQYYLIWPLVIVIALLVLRLRRSSTPAAWKPVLLTTIGVLSLASLIWSVHDTAVSPTTAYFSTFTRGWELGLGSLTAVLLFNVTWRPPRWLGEAVPALGLVTVLVSALLFDASLHVPGWIMTIPVVGAALVLGAVPDGLPTAVARLLSIRPMRVIGDWSYSLYLWHFPVIKLAEAKYGEGRLTHPQMLAAVVLIFALSAASYYLVEEPVRRSGWFQARRWRAVALYPAGLALVLLTAVVGRQYIDHELGVGGDHPAISTKQFRGQHLSADPHVALVQASVLAARKGQAVPSDLSPPVLGIRQATAPLGDCDYRTGTHRLCAEGDPTADKTIVMVGDSYGRAWSPAVDEIGKREGYRVYNLVYSGCSPFDAVRIDGATKRVDTACQAFKDWTRQTIAKLHPDLVVVASSAKGPLVAPDGDYVGYEHGREAFLKVVSTSFRDELSGFVAHADKVAVIANTPMLPRETGVCLSQRGIDLGDCLFHPEPLAGRIQADYLAQARKVGAVPVDVRRWFCYQNECPSVIGRTITMRDKEHVTPEYARQLAGPIAQVLRADGVGTANQ